MRLPRLSPAVGTGVREEWAMVACLGKAQLWWLWKELWTGGHVGLRSVYQLYHSARTSSASLGLHS